VIPRKGRTRESGTPRTDLVTVDDDFRWGACSPMGLWSKAFRVGKGAGEEVGQEIPAGLERAPPLKGKIAREALESALPFSHMLLYCKGFGAELVQRRGL